MYDSSNFQRSTGSTLSWAASLVLRAHEHVPWRRWGGTHRVFRQHCNCSVWMCVGFLTEGLERKDDPTKCSCSLLYTVIFIPCVRCLSCFDIYVFPCSRLKKWVLVIPSGLFNVTDNGGPRIQSGNKEPDKKMPHVQLENFTRGFMLPNFTS